MVRKFLIGLLLFGMIASCFAGYSSGGRSGFSSGSSRSYSSSASRSSSYSSGRSGYSKPSTTYRPYISPRSSSSSISSSSSTVVNNHHYGSSHSGFGGGFWSGMLGGYIGGSLAGSHHTTVVSGAAPVAAQAVTGPLVDGYAYPAQNYNPMSSFAWICMSIFLTLGILFVIMLFIRFLNRN